MNNHCKRHNGPQSWMLLPKSSARTTTPRYIQANHKLWPNNSNMSPSSRKKTVNCVPAVANLSSTPTSSLATHFNSLQQTESNQWSLHILALVVQINDKDTQWSKSGWTNLYQTQTKVSQKEWGSPSQHWEAQRWVWRNLLAELDSHFPKISRTSTNNLKNLWILCKERR